MERSEKKPDQKEIRMGNDNDNQTHGHNTVTLVFGMISCSVLWFSSLTWLSNDRPAAIPPTPAAAVPPAAPSLPNLSMPLEYELPLPGTIVRFVEGAPPIPRPDIPPPEISDIAGSWCVEGVLAALLSWTRGAEMAPVSVLRSRRRRAAEPIVRQPQNAKRAMRRAMSWWRDG